MSSDDYFEDEFDSAFLKEVDAIEAAHVSTAPTVHPSKPTPKTTTAPPKPSLATTVSLTTASSSYKVLQADVVELVDDSSDYDNAFDDLAVDDADFAVLDQEIQRKYDELRDRQRPATSHLAAGSSKSNGLVRRPSKGAQLNLFGEVAREEPTETSRESNKRTFQRTRSTLRQLPLPGQARKTKQWDRTAYAKTGWRKPKVIPDKVIPDKGKGKGRASDDEDEDEVVEFEQFPAPEIPVGPVPSMKLVADRLAAKTWIYPLNKPRRDYQYNIVKNCLVDNTLVALPTGLGKTFIAGVVMLNFYNWFPQGKVVFVAPTKPLVAQQIDACHKTCGIPGSAAAELTGNVAKDKRVNAWRTKRVVYATPQTLLNDLINGHVDALDIVLIVIDEAHRGTGDYAYAQVVRYMMQHNPHFRVLALTATPGGKPEAVQEIVDALHISHIEIRSESDPDLKKYLHAKFEQEHFIHMTQEIAILRDALAELIAPIVKKVQSAGFLKSGNVSPTVIHPFRCQATVGEMNKARAPQWAVSAAAQLGPLARAMGYLMENSISMCYGYLKGIVDGLDDNNGKKAIRKMDGFKSLMKKFEEQASRGFSMHPKMDVLRTLLIDNFAKELPDEQDSTNAQRRESRAMVFVSFRECVEEIVELLNKESPMIRAKAFIGQATDKQGKKGYAQKEQLEVIEKFKAGVYNVLVSTSIGEEGLDIGEVDLIVCYDAQKTPIRMLQRIGRTGRKASGTVHILLAKGREEHNWQKALANYAEVQHFIVRASDLEVYGDVRRLLPDDIEPECVEMMMEIEEYVREDRTSRKGSLATGNSSGKSQKRRRDDDPMRNIPASAAKGFVSVGELLIKGGAKLKKKMAAVDIEHADEDDSDDEDIEAGIFGPRRTKSASTASEAKKGKKKALARSATVAGGSKRKAAARARIKKKPAKQVTLTQVDPVSSDDSDDEAIERGLFVSSDDEPASAEIKSSKLNRIQIKRTVEPTWRSSSPDIPLNDSVIDIASTPGDSTTRSAHAILDFSPDRPSTHRRTRTNAPILGSSPDRPPRARSRSTSANTRSQSIKSSQSQNKSSSGPPERSTSPSSRSVSADQPAGRDDSMAWLIEDDDEPLIPELTLSPPRFTAQAQARTLSEEPLFLESSPAREISPPQPPSDDEPVFLDEPPPPQSPKRSGPSYKTSMGPPALPIRVTTVSPSFSSFSDDLAPEPSFAVRAPGKHARKRAVTEVIDIDSSPLTRPPSSQRRLQRARPRSPSPTAAATAPPRKKRRKFRDAADAARHNPWIDVEAGHSGDELSVGSSEPELLADSEDGMFLGEPGATQVSPSYDQTAVYRRSLMTQAPGDSGPTFANRPARHGQASFGLGRAAASASRYARAQTSSPVRVDEQDEYVFGSFVVDDDMDISFDNAPSSDL